MANLNSIRPDQVPSEEEKRLQNEFDRCLLMKETFWHQRSRIKWAMFGDRNSSFFHASTVNRRRNAIGSLFIPGSGWETDEGNIRRAFVSHFKRIYSK